MQESWEPSGPTHPGPDGPSRLLALVDRSAPPRRPIGGLIADWFRSSGTDLPFEEWADPATRRLAATFDAGADLVQVEYAVVAFAQARAGADHSAEAIAADLVALVRLAWPSGGRVWVDWIDPVGLLARALSAWAIERETGRACQGDCYDPVTGLVSAQYLRARLHELHGQCDALMISPPVTFGALVVHLELGAVPAPERIGVRVAAGRILAGRFRAGETVAALSADRLVAVMPAYGIDRCLGEVATDFAAFDGRDGVRVSISRVAFADDAGATFETLAGTSVGS
jgi:hypothetical protein